MALTWTDVDSSTVERVAYDEATETLAVQFKGNTLYTYKSVDMDVYVALVHAESVGRYLNQSVKGLFSYEKHDSVDQLEATIFKKTA